MIEKYLVVFFKVADPQLLFCLGDKEYNQCMVLKPIDTDKFIGVNLTEKRLEIGLITCPQDKLKDAIEGVHDIIEIECINESGFDRLTTGVFSCVKCVKLVLGINNRKIRTPEHLYVHLLKRLRGKSWAAGDR